MMVRWLRLGGHVVYVVRGEQRTTACGSAISPLYPSSSIGGGRVGCKGLLFTVRRLGICVSVMVLPALIWLLGSVSRVGLMLKNKRDTPSETRST